jgi:hypothetical protein
LNQPPPVEVWLKLGSDADMVVECVVGARAFDSKQDFLAGEVVSDEFNG